MRPAFAEVRRALPAAVVSWALEDSEAPAVRLDVDGLSGLSCAAILRQPSRGLRNR